VELLFNGCRRYIVGGLNKMDPFELVEGIIGMPSSLLDECRSFSIANSLFRVRDPISSSCSTPSFTAFPNFWLLGTMHREQLPTDRLALWAKLNNVERNGIAATTLPGNRGTGLVATTDMSDTDPILVTVSQELVLSLENVWVYAKADQHLLQVLEAVGEYSRVLRSANCKHTTAMWEIIG